MNKLSFEFFPPKTQNAKLKFQKTTQELASLEPDFFSVTYGAAGSTQDGTLETALETTNITSVETAPHLSCIVATKTQLTDTIQKYQSQGIKRIIVLRGDMPSGTLNTGDVAYACDLVHLIREVSGDHFHITVAAYPEIHPEAEDAFKDLTYLKAKVDAGANCAITQFFYNADAYFDLMDRCIQHNIQIPIIPGIMPIVNFQKLQQFSKNCGAEIPRWIIKRMEAYSNDQISLANFAIELVYKLCERLLNNNAPGLHFYTLNQADKCLKICELLKLGTRANGLLV